MTDHNPAPEPDSLGTIKRFARRVLEVWYAPMLLALPFASASRDRLRADVVRWVNITGTGTSASEDADGNWRNTLSLLAAYSEFRTLYCYRLRRAGALSAALAALFAVIYPGERTLHLACGDIGGGLFIQHGFATIVAARKVGRDCWINQQVTVGFDRPGARPTLGDRVSIHAGAKVLGELTVHDDARVGANAVVVHDVPAGYTAVGVPAHNLAPKSQRH